MCRANDESARSHSMARNVFGARALTLILPLLLLLLLASTSTSRIVEATNERAASGARARRGDATREFFFITLIADEHRTHADVERVSRVMVTKLRNGGSTAEVFVIDDNALGCRASAEEAEDVATFFAEQLETHYVEMPSRNRKRMYRKGTEDIERGKARDGEARRAFEGGKRNERRMKLKDKLSRRRRRLNRNTEL